MRSGKKEEAATCALSGSSQGVRFLADESAHGEIVRALVASGHDVGLLSPEQRGMADPEVLALAFSGNRILLTEDADFGELIFVRGQPAYGVLFMRYPPLIHREFVLEVTALVAREGERLAGNFVVVAPGNFRSTPLPSP